jgi:NTE family protein
MQRPGTPGRPASYDKKVALVLQGGGALGSYQAGVYDALSESDYLPDWVAGISIGAINAAIIAGNAPSRRVAKLRDFWEMVTAPPAAWSAWLGLAAPLFPAHRRHIGAAGALVFGQNGFFGPRSPFDWMAAEGPTSFYDTAALRSTLEDLVDFDRINARETRLSIGAVNVRTGNFAYFDSAEMRIGPEHIMASGALPPGFPSVEIEGEHYWDGGYLGNPALWPLYYERGAPDIVLVQINALLRPELPTTPSDIMNRLNEISFNASLMAEMRAIDFVQRLLDSGRLEQPRYRRIFLHLIEDEDRMREFKLSTKLNGDWEFLLKLRQYGREAAERFLDTQAASVGRESTMDIKRFL